MNPAPTSSPAAGPVQAGVVVDELVRLGVTDAVLCPGSRNAPLAFALHAADAAGRLRLHVRIDERTGGFLALGLALGSGRPVPVVTTSGTAVANLHPAVLEASHSGVPLLALTADRPPELVGTGASQTIEQQGIFGGAVRRAGTLAVARPAPGEPGRWRAAVDRIVAAATGALGEPPGPVHLNIPFAEPLVPDPADQVPPGRPDGAPWTVVPPARRTAPTLPLDPEAPTLVVAGGGAGIDPALLGGAPVVAEPSSPLWPHALRSGPWLLGASGGPPRPTQVLVVGRPTLHRAVARLLAAPDLQVYAAADPHGMPWTDVAGTVRAVGDVPALAPPRDWVRRWHEADEAASAALDRALPEGPRGLSLARDLVAGLPDGSRLVLGSSNPVRDVSLAAVPRSGLSVLSNRGVAGIDGTVSTAVGAALTHPGPTVALLGDLTLLHDATGLLIGPDEPRPALSIVVLNDSGGGIFGLLEQGAPAHSASFERVFGTPHRADLAAVATGLGAAHVLVTAPSSLVEAVLPAGPGLRIVEVRADRATLRAGHAALTDEIATALAALPART
ncbi:2-succinyl-5-enolpyruvyl-6-hydroxy-3-cyclohexene-1-carboxylic-acid synthase [Pseudonocardia yuanmonensis]|uniref:2-succinyl-5-enolpyruvyl-6-hydroxy-3- cyclohexene-1-carboxylic-acid synthase n=1 Tax=Pseudonocardia yuanmonensis TaxID=1095914 RepID=UPI0031F0D30E